MVGLLAGCGRNIDGDLIDVSAELSERIPSVLLVEWRSDQPGRSYVEYGLDGALGLRTSVVEDGDLSHFQPVLGLKAGYTYSFQAVTETAGGLALRSEVGRVEVPLPPSELPAFFLSEADDSATQAGGFILTSVMLDGPSWAVILDRDGDVVWYYSAGPPLGIPTTRLSRDGESVMMITNDLELETDLGGVLRLSLDGERETSTRLPASHHDFAELPGGRIAWIAADIRELTRDGVEETVVGDEILVRPEGGSGETETVFNLFDDYAEVWRPCNHYDDEAFGIEGSKDWSHVNSLLYDDAEDDLLLLSKNFDALLRVDLESGELVEQIGGLYATRAFADGTLAWSHGHMSQAYEGGMVVFDNGYHHDPVASRVVEYAWDGPEDAVREVWSYNDPDGRFVQALGDVRKLPNGNMLAAWTTGGFITELTPAGEVVWRLDTEVGHNIGRVSWIEDLYGGE